MASPVRHPISEPWRSGAASLRTPLNPARNTPGSILTGKSTGGPSEPSAGGPRRIFERDRVRTMNTARRHLLSGLKLFLAAAIVWTCSNAMAADGYVPFPGEKTTWHEGFDRYDFVMDDATGAMTPIKAPTSEVASFGVDETPKDGKRRCVVVSPTKAALGNPWSWRSCYWNHQPQAEVELLRRGFH